MNSAYSKITDPITKKKYDTLSENGRKLLKILYNNFI